MNVCEKDTYLPLSCIHEAKDFLETLKDEVDIYRQLIKLRYAQADPEAEKFCAYFIMGSYSRFPHALITLYEAHAAIDEAFGPYDTQNIFAFMQYRMKSYYRLLKQNGMIDD